MIGCQEMTKPVEIQSGYIEINEANHYYNLTGSGDTLVILHGGPGFSHKYLKPQIDSLLSSKLTLLYYDQRGSGWTNGEKDSIRLNIETYVEDLEQLRKYFNLKKFNLLGHSFGGLLGMQYAIKYPENVSSLILVDPDAASFELRTPYQIKMINSRLTEEQEEYLDSLEHTEKFESLEVSVYEKYYRSYLTTYFSNPLDTANLILGFDSISIPKISTTNKTVRDQLGAYDIHNELSTITCKTLIMQGTESVFSIEGAMAINQRIPLSEIHLFENCGHFEYIESPSKFKRLILNFYDLHE